MLAGACLLANDATAQSLFGYNNRYRDYTAEYTMIRIGMMVISIGAGFGLGWLCSPQTKPVRDMAMFCVGGLAIAIAIFNTGVLGWSMAWLVSFVGFLLALGYWLGRAVRALGKVPTTFGS